LAARYPALGDAEPSSQQFWDSLCAGANLSRTVPLARWDIDDVYAPDMAAKRMYVLFFLWLLVCEDIST
jgi:acyl transferase domain-containing protein